MRYLALALLVPLFSLYGLTIEEIVNSKELTSPLLHNVQWRPGHEAFSYTKTTDEGMEIWLCDGRTGQIELLIAAGDLNLSTARRENRFTLPSYKWSPDGQRLLFPAENDLFLFDLEKHITIQLTSDDETERDPQFSPDGSKIAYLKKDNLYVYDLDANRERALTKRGTKELLVGRFDWTYEEEFSIRTGFSWSPTSSHIAFFQLDITQVPEFPIVDFEPIHNRVHMMRYAKAGDPNALVNIGVLNINSDAITWMDIEADPDSSYLPRTAWFPDGSKLAISWLNRRQNHLVLYAGDVFTGAVSPLLQESSSSGWLEPERVPHFLDRNRFLWLSEHDGFNHIYLYDIEKDNAVQLTRGSWDVRKILYADAKQVIFDAFKERYEDLDLYAINTNGKKLRRLTKGHGVHAINMAPDGRYFIDTCSNLATPMHQSLYNSDGEQIVQLSDPPQAAVNIMQKYDFEMLSIPLEGRTLNGILMHARRWDPTIPHPLLIYCYGGPGSHLITNSWRRTRTLLHAKFIDQGFLVLTINSRGAADRGVAWKHSVYKHLGDYEIQDHIDAAQWAASQPYVDKNRIGIWGWSYGGYTTIMSMLKGNIFKAGVAVAPVTDWRNYDTIYTERFMDLPQSNPQGYEEGSALNVADRLNGSLLIMHGTKDDNVHMSNSMQLAKKLQDYKKDFDLMIYPGKTHGLRGTATSVHVYKKIYHYILDKLVNNNIEHPS